MTFDFFNDFALVVFKQSEFHNVIATCLKLSDDEQNYTLRIIRNDNDHDDFLTEMKNIITIVNEKFVIDSTNYE